MHRLIKFLDWILTVSVFNIFMVGISLTFDINFHFSVYFALGVLGAELYNLKRKILDIWVRSRYDRFG